MKKSIFMTVLVVSASAATAQIVEHNRSNSQTKESQKSNGQTRSITKTMTAGSLFFPKLAELEKHIWDSVPIKKDGEHFDEYQNKFITAQQIFFAKKQADGKMSFLNERWLVTSCDVFSTTGRFVWSHDQNQHRDSRNENGVIVFKEPLSTIGSGDSVSYNSTSIGLFGFPVFAAEKVRCSALYADLIDSAIDKLMKKGAIINNQTISIKNLEFESEIALWDSFYTLFKHNRYDVLPKDQKCNIPSAEGTRLGGPKDYQCGQWFISQSNFSAKKAGVTILDQNYINGRAWTFQESTTSASTTSNKRSNTRGTTQKANVAN